MAKILSFFWTIRNNLQKSLVACAAVTYGIFYSKEVCEKAKKLFQNYCEPLLHLGGIALTIIQTESQNDAHKIIMNLDISTNAGGDGTLSDVLTGLLKKYDLNLNSVKQCPSGILSLGQTNKIAKSLYHEYDNLSDIKQMIEATMIIIHEKLKVMDMIEINPIDNNHKEPVKPIYGLGAVE